MKALTPRVVVENFDEICMKSIQFGRQNVLVFIEVHSTGVMSLKYFTVQNNYF